MKMKCDMIIRKVMKIRVKRRDEIVLGVINMMIMKMGSKMKLNIRTLERIKVKLKLDWV